ncbi:hypothetical protein EAG_10626, partial [Camponotus floridanus]
ILNVIPLPTHNDVNKFAYTKINNKLIAINSDKRIYRCNFKQNLNNCINNNNQYLCEKSQPIYHINKNTPCEIKMYMRTQDNSKQCNIDYTITNRTIWIML